jgi:hypothetical protein
MVEHRIRLKQGSKIFKHREFSSSHGLTLLLRLSHIYAHQNHTNISANLTTMANQQIEAALHLALAVTLF